MYYSAVSDTKNEKCLDYGLLNYIDGNAFKARDPQTTNLHKGCHPENPADEGGSAEKSQECRRYPLIVLDYREADQRFVSV